MRPLQRNVVCFDAGGFADPRAARAKKSRKARCADPGGVFESGGDEDVHFGLGEVIYCLNVRPFNGNRQHALGDAEGRRVGGSDVVEERSIAAKLALRVATELLRFSSGS